MRKKLRIEALEARRLMAADYFFSHKPWDTTGDGLVAPLDALVVISELNAFGARMASGPDDRLDVNKDFYVSPIDALWVINEINAPDQSTIGSDLQMFLKIDGIQGDVTVEDYRDWIDISAYSFESRYYGDGGPGISQLGDLELLAPLSSAMPDLALALAQGKTFPSARLVVAKQFADRLQPVSQWELSDCMLKSFDTATGEGRGSGQAFSLSYSRVEWTYYRYADNGTPLDTVTQGWDIERNATALTAGWGERSAVAQYQNLQQAVASVGSRDMQLFLSLDGIKGDVSVEGFADWIDISSFSFESRYLVDGRTGLSQLGDLQLVAPLSSAMPDLALALAQGKTFAKARLVLARGMSDGLKPITQWELGDVSLSSFDAATWEGQGSGQALSLKYNRVQWKYYTYGADGQASGTITKAWDLERNATALTASSGTTSGVEQYQDMQQVVGSVGSRDIQLFLSIDGIEGDVEVEDYERWIDVSSFSFESRYLADGGAGISDLGDLQLVAPLSSVMPELALALAQGRLFDNARLVLAQPMDGVLRPVSQWQLSDAMLTSFDAATGEGLGSGQALSMTFSKIEWTYYRYDQEGLPLGTIRKAWDVSNNSSALTAGSGATTGVTHYQDLQQVVASVGAGDMQMFLSLEGIQGDVTAIDYRDWIDISSFSFESRRLGTERTGVSLLGDLQLVGPLSNAMPELALALAQGKVFDKARLVLAQPIGGELRPISQWDLTDVMLTSFDSATAEGRDSGQALSLQYNRIQWTHYRYGRDGTPLDSISKSWEIQREVPALAGQWETISAAEHYQSLQQVVATVGQRDMQIFLSLDGIQGDVQVEEFRDWIDISSFGFESLRIGTGRVGISQLGDLQLVAPLSSAMPALAVALAQGKSFDRARLVVARRVGDELRPISQLQLRNVLLSSFDAATGEGRGSGQAFSLRYTQVEWTYYPYADDGRPLTAVKRSWDVEGAGTALTAGWGATPPAEQYHYLQQTIASVGDRDTQMFLRLDGVQGDVTAADYENWIDISSYGFESRRLGSGHLAVTELGDLQLVAPLGNVMPELALALAQGKTFTKARLVLTREVDGLLQPVSQWELRDVLLSSFDAAGAEGRGNGQAFSLKYDRVEWTYYRYDENGQPQPPIQQSWVNADPTLLAAGDEASPESGGLSGGLPPTGLQGSVNLQATLPAIIDAAIDGWLKTGVSRDRLAGLEFIVTDLPNQLLGLNHGNLLFVDADAAGRGWFIDHTPELDEEFTYGRAIEGGPAAGRFDLLTAVSHEIGHFLGLDHDYGTDSEHSLMQASLDPGERYRPAK